jgi:hypothetical protein
MDVDMQFGHALAAWTWTCSVDMRDMQHVLGQAMDMDIDYYWTGAITCNY